MEVDVSIKESQKEKAVQLLKRLRNLVYEYVESEDCDIASYNDLADLVYGFLH